MDWYSRKVDFYDWWSFLKEEGARRGYDMDTLGNANVVMESFPVDVAASTQKLFEETMLTGTELAWDIQRKLGLNTADLCLSGGCALNCPANERIAKESSFSRTFIEPCCDGSGLAIGAALFAFHNICGGSRRIDPKSDFSPYLGPRYTSEDFVSTLSAWDSRVDVEECDHPERYAAEDLEQNLIVGWFQGRSEVGPRALGSRSILANPIYGDNWGRVNRIKSREAWRPFAPAVLEEESEHFFLSAQPKSPFMLFNAIVKSERIPAVTHVDQSSRIQTVSSRNQSFHSLLQNFHELSGVPVVLNTSFNGPGEPIVESPHDALKFFIESELDVLYLGRLRIRRGSSEPTKENTMD